MEKNQKPLLFKYSLTTKNFKDWIFITKLSSPKGKKKPSFTNHFQIPTSNLLIPSGFWGLMLKNMSLPWKKMKKGTKMSQFVNDHLNKSQKRRDGSSLVVETGFPTSLIDLFMKNREKLRKKKRSCSKRLTFSPIEVTETVISQSPVSSPLPVNEDLVVQEFDAIDESVTVKESDGVVLEKGERVRFDANGVLLAVLKMVLVVGLASKVKRLTLGVTLSAFLLFFLDYLGKHVNLLKRLMSKFNRFKKGSVFVQEINQERFKNQEIQPVEVECDLVAKTEEIRCDNEIKEEERLEFGETKLKDLLMENDDFVYGVGLGRRKPKKDRIKSKVKCFVMKLRKCKKDEHHVGRVESFSDDHVSLSEELESDQCMREVESESLTGLSTNCALGGFSETSDQVAMKSENGIRGQKSVQMWSCLLLGLIVLIGLIRGRSFALILTLSWFSLLKLGEKLQKHLKVVKIMSFNDKCS